MIEIHVFGNLRQQVRTAGPSSATVIRLFGRPTETVASVLERIGLDPDAVHTIFVNHRLLAARSNMARWLGHPRAAGDPLTWNLDRPLADNDRVGLFGRDMAALVI